MMQYEVWISLKKCKRSVTLFDTSIYWSVKPVPISGKPVATSGRPGYPTLCISVFPKGAHFQDIPNKEYSFYNEVFNCGVSHILEMDNCGLFWSNKAQTPIKVKCFEVWQLRDNHYQWLSTIIHHYPQIYIYFRRICSSFTLLVCYSVTASPAQTVGSLIGNQAVNLYGGPEASAECEYPIIQEN